MAAYSPLLHLHANVGRRGGIRGRYHQETTPNSQGETAELDPEQGPRAPHQELHPRLERWAGHRRPRRCCGTRLAIQSPCLMRTSKISRRSWFWLFITQSADIYCCGALCIYCGTLCQYKLAFSLGPLQNCWALKNRAHAQTFEGAPRPRLGQRRPWPLCKFLAWIKAPEKDSETSDH